MARVLQRRDVAVTEYPRPAADGAGRQVGELHGVRSQARERRAGELGYRRLLVDRDVAQLGLGVDAARAARRHADGVDAGLGVQVRRALERRRALVAEVPEPARDVARREVAEAHADDPISIGDAAFVFLRVRLIEVVTDRYLVVEQGHVLVQGLLVELLLVERPPELVERELVVRGGGAQADDRRIGALGVEVASAREEVLAPPELHFVVVLGMRIRAYQALHRFHGLIGAAEFVVRPRLLIEDLVSVLVIRVLGQQPVIESDRLEGTRGSCISAHRPRRRGASVAARQDPALRGRAPLEILIGFPQAGAGDRRGRIGPVGLRARECLGGLRVGHFPRPGVARAYPELLLDLQVRETPHRLRSHRGLRCLLEEAPVVVHGLIEALLDLHLLHVRARVTQLRQRPHRLVLVDTRGAAGHESQREHHRNGEATHQRPSPPDWARAARS